MKKFLIVFNKAICIISWAIMIIALIYLLIMWKNLTDEIGVHFGPNGEFDVYASKWYALYPYIVGFGTLILMWLANLVASKVKSGLKMNKKGEDELKMSINTFTSVLGFIVAVFFAYWAYCVINQVFLSVTIGRIMAYSVIFNFLAFIVSMIIIRVKNPKESKSE